MLFEISEALHDGVDFLNVKDADNQPARLISRFVNTVNNFSYALIFTFLWQSILDVLIFPAPFVG